MKNNITSLTPAELMLRIHDKEDLLLVDVREKWEHEDFNIGGTLIPLSTIFENVDLISKETPVVVYCHKGIRSQIAIQRLQDRFGFDNLINLSGGMEAWEKEMQKQTSDKPVR